METIKTRGRPPGSVNWIVVTLGDIIAALGTENAKVHVVKGWAEAVGVVSREQGQQETVNEPKIQFNVE